MDPDANIAEQWRIRARIKAKEAHKGDRGRLAELVRAYKEWVSRGGFRASIDKVGARVELHPGVDLWMRGARFGTVRRVIGERPSDAILVVKMDHPQVRKLARLPFDRVKFL